MTLAPFWFSQLTALAFVVLVIHIQLVLGNVGVPSCDDTICQPGQECFMKSVDCGQRSCAEIPSCHPSCNVTRCVKGFFCTNGQCFEEGDSSNNSEPNCNVTSCVDGFVCNEGQCLVDKNAAIDFCATVVCEEGFNCTNGSCVSESLCDGFKCEPGEECYIVSHECLGSSCLSLPACRPDLNCNTVTCLVHYMLGIVLLYIFFIAPFCLYFIVRKSCHQAKVEPSPA